MIAFSMLEPYWLVIQETLEDGEKDLAPEAVPNR